MIKTRYDCVNDTIPHFLPKMVIICLVQGTGCQVSLSTYCKCFNKGKQCELRKVIYEVKVQDHERGVFVSQPELGGRGLWK